VVQILRFLAAEKPNPPVLQIADKWFATSAVATYRRNEQLVSEVRIITDSPTTRLYHSQLRLVLDLATLELGMQG